MANSISIPGETSLNNSSNPNNASVAGAQNGVGSAAQGASGEASAVQAPQTLGEESYQRIKHLAEALEEDELPRINTNLRAIAITALGAMPRIQAMRAEVVRQIPQHDMTLFDAFEDIVLALNYTDSVVRASTDEKKELSVLADALDAKRRQLLNLASGFAGFGLIDSRPIQFLGKETGYRPLTRDISTLVQLFRQNWAKVGSHSPVTLQELANIDRDALALSTAIGLKEQMPEGPREEMLQRHRVYTLFRHAVTDIRRLGIYLFGESGVDSIVPAFSHGGRSSGRNDAAEDETEQETETEHGSPAPAPVVAKDRAPEFTVNNPHNLPITSPFTEKVSA